MRISRVPLIGMQQTIRMLTLQIAFDSLWTQFPVVEREFVPRLKSDHLIILH